MEKKTHTLDSKQIALIAVTITQIIKTNLDKSPEETVRLIQSALHEFSSDFIIELITRMADEHQLTYVDVNDIVLLLQEEAKDATDLQWNIHWQSIADSLFYVWHLVKGIVPPQWAIVGDTVEKLYQMIFKPKE